MAIQRVTVASDKKIDTGRNAQTGKEWKQEYQDGYLHEAGKPYPTSCRIPLYDGARPFPLGEMQTDQRLEIDQYGKLRVQSDLALSPVAAKA